LALRGLKMGGGALVYDVTVRFCTRYINKRSRTFDQMVQAARSGVQNIVEGSMASGTSKKTELKLTNVARASLEELHMDYLGFLRQSNRPVWSADDPRRKSLIDKRCSTADEVSLWVRQTAREEHSDGEEASTLYPEISANAVLTLISVAASLLDRQIDAQATAFKSEGGFTERLYKTRRNQGKNS
jgi:four helix bundle suffix protein